MTETIEYRKKPVVIEAMQFGGKWAHAAPILEWAADAYFVPEGYEHPMRYDVEIDRSNADVRDYAPAFLVIKTLEGNHRADRGDFIIRGVQGEFYPCKPDIFAATYTTVDDETEDPIRAAIRTLAVAAGMTIEDAERAVLQTIEMLAIGESVPAVFEAETP